MAVSAAAPSAAGCARTIRRIMDEALGSARHPATAARDPRNPGSAAAGRPSGSTDRLLGQGRTRRPHAFEQLVDLCLVRHRPYRRRLNFLLKIIPHVDGSARICELGEGG
jgi:hypothetical protein